MDSSPDQAHLSGELLAFERRKAMMRNLVFGLVLEPSERQQSAHDAGER